MHYAVARMRSPDATEASLEEVERALQKAVADGLPPLTRLYHKGKAEPTVADAEPIAADAEPNSPEQKAILYSTFLQYANFGQRTPSSASRSSRESARSTSADSATPCSRFSRRRWRRRSAQSSKFSSATPISRRA